MAQLELTEQLKSFRADRPDEWRMDEFIRHAENIEKEIASLISYADTCAGILRDQGFAGKAEALEERYMKFAFLLGDDS